MTPDPLGILLGLAAIIFAILAGLALCIWASKP